MKKQQSNALCWLEFPLLGTCPQVTHGVFTRKNLNVAARNTDDSPSNDTSNSRGKIKSALQIPKLISAKQVHGTAIVEIGVEHQEGDMPICDGLMTNQPNIGLMIQHADCQVALFYDPMHHAIAAVHCGWRGSVQNIYAAAISAMENAFNSSPKDLIVTIGPSLGPEAAEFVNHQQELPSSFLPFQTTPNHFNFWSISEWQLLECGILPQNIEIAKICTYDTPGDFFSYRRNRTAERNGTVVMLISSERPGF